MKPIEKAWQIRMKLNSVVSEMTDEQAVDYVVLFPQWSGNGIEYKTGERVVYNDMLYYILQDHISQLDWTPDVAHSLYAPVLIPDPTKINPWERPKAGTNGYMKGDKVLWNGVVKESTIDYNHYSPDEYPAGWKDVTE